MKLIKLSELSQDRIYLMYIGGSRRTDIKEVTILTPAHVSRYETFMNLYSAYAEVWFSIINRYYEVKMVKGVYTEGRQSHAMIFSENCTFYELDKDEIDFLYMGLL